MQAQSDDPAIEAKQNIRAEFQSKVIKAKADGTETDATIKKKPYEASINTGEGDISGKTNTDTACSIVQSEREIHSDTLEHGSAKNSKEQVKADEVDLTTEAAPNKVKVLQDNEKLSMSNGNNQKTTKLNNPTKTISDISKEDKIQEIWVQKILFIIVLKLSTSKHLIFI